jgi:hypothetical protein
MTANNTSAAEAEAEAENAKHPPVTSPLLDEVVSESPALGPSHHKNHATPPHSTSSTPPRRNQQPPGSSKWSPGFVRRFPLIGIVALVGCVACIAASVGVLVASNGQPIDSWTISPALYLALLTTALNTLAGVAFGEGVKIAWWSSAVRGTTVFSLQSYWASGDSILHAAKPSRGGFNIVSLAKLAVSLIAIDQPLIQRASSVVSRHPSEGIQVTAPIAPEIPYGYTGVPYGQAPTLNNISMSVPMLNAFNAYTQRRPITHTFTGCRDTDTCTGVVQAGGFAADCSTSDYSSDPYSIISTTATLVLKTLSPFNASCSVPLAAVDETPSITASVFYSHRNSGNCSDATLTSTS